MKKIALFFLTIFTLAKVQSQNLYTEKFDDCGLSDFCLDCGDTKAQPPENILEEIFNNLDKSSRTKIKGIIEIQVLIDRSGKPCLLSADNQTNISSKKLNLKKAINNTSYWQPALSENKKENSSVSIILEFENGNVISAKRRIFDFTNQSNAKSTGTPDIKGTDKEKLSRTWTLFTQENSELPWDITRAVVTDLDNNIWIGTDNGIVKIYNNNWTHYNSKNTIIASPAYNKNETQSIRYAEVDKENNKWFIVGWALYKYDNNKWTKYDSLNSPINWARKIFVDNSNNVWFTSWDGVSMFDGKNWTVYNKQNSQLPSDKILSVYVDKSNKIWIGTFEGNVIIENGKTNLLNDKNSPLSKAYISKMYEDTKGNIWFDLYNDQSSNDEGIYILDTLEKWTKIDFPDEKMLKENSINDFLLDEDKNQLWVTLNGVGILCYDLETKKWEVYTNENSNVPSVHAEQITKDKNGTIWIATYSGVIKLNEQ
ncbi:MAG: two-component regulator propeller domain-containing protein [Bacteroidia bacterium]